MPSGRRRVLLIALAVVGVIGAGVFAKWLKELLDQSSALGALRGISSRQSAYRERHGAFARDLAALEEVSRAEFPLPRDGTIGIYTIEIVTATATTWSAVAYPRGQMRGDLYSYYWDETICRWRLAKDGVAGPRDLPLGMERPKPPKPAH